MHVVEKERIPRLSLGEERNMVTQLLLVNITVFVLLFFTQVIYNIEGLTTAQFNKDILTWALLPAEPSALLRSPWTLLTSLFTHISFWHIFSNMVWLWCFGTLLQNLAGYQRILPLYLFSGLCGSVFYLAGMQFIPAFNALQPGAALTGATASVMALAIGATTVAPGYRIFPLLGGGIPLWVLTSLFVALHIGTHAFSLQEATRLPALLGGGLTGFFYMRQWKKGKDWGARLNRFTFKATHVFHPADQQVDPSIVKKKMLSTPQNSTPYRKIGNVSEQRLNEILDKINEQGMRSLTAEERETLLRASMD